MKKVMLILLLIGTQKARVVAKETLYRVTQNQMDESKER